MSDALNINGTGRDNNSAQRRWKGEFTEGHETYVDCLITESYLSRG